MNLSLVSGMEIGSSGPTVLLLGLGILLYNLHSATLHLLPLRGGHIAQRKQEGDATPLPRLK